MYKNLEGESYMELTTSNQCVDAAIRKDSYSGFLVNDKISSISALVQNNAVLIDKALDITSQIVDVYGESQRLAAQVEVVREMSKVELAKTAAKFQLTKSIIEKTFAERKETLSKFYDVLDNAIERGNEDLIIKAMHEIGSVVVSSPLADIQNFVKRFEDTNMPLLDF